MKVSKYNIIIPQNNFVILYNSFKDVFCGVSQTIATLLQSGDIDRLRNYAHDSFLSLYKKGFIIDDCVNEMDLIKEEYNNAKYGQEQFYLMVFPTQDCNLKCWYCYESHKPNTRMSQTVIGDILKHVERKLKESSIRRFRLGFFGGEPLIDFDRIGYPLAKGIKALCDNKGISFASFFVTNATLISDSMISKFEELNPYFQITLDGDKNKHNNVRIWKDDNRGTYEQIVSSIMKLASRIPYTKDSDDPRITLRINYDNNTLRNLDSLLSDIKDINRDQISIHFERVWQTRDAVDDVQRELLINTITKFVKAGFIITHGIFRRKSISCPSDSDNFYIVNYDGTIHKCNGRTLSDETREGYLNHDGNLEWDMKRRNFRLGIITFDNEACRNCKILPLCMGPCSQKLIESGAFCKQICSRRSIDMSVEDYLSAEFEMRYIHSKI